MRNSARDRSRGATLIQVMSVVLVFGLVAWYVVSCPCERTPGLWLFGDRVEQPVADWSFANDVPLCQIEVDRAIVPHSINLNCMATDDGQLYLSCAECEGKVWSSVALEDPEAKLRLGDDLYPVTLERVEDPEELAAAWRAREEKMQRPTDTPPQPGWWSFRVTSRG